jgi:hypothetical protein
VPLTDLLPDAFTAHDMAGHDPGGREVQQ